ncbi:MAG: histidine phosphatase family protein [Ferrovum sp.]|nr:histidine phosphatase family protein [Ferrovum sp.]NDU87332.1 histidine phosphatase family protein [Ferrovum sp.]
MSTVNLLLWRHAEAEEGYPDEARALTPKGRRQAQRVADWLTQHLPSPPHLLVSPARRTQQTAQAYASDFATHASIGTQARPRDILQACGWPHPAHTTILVVGHQPTLGQCAALLLAADTAPWSIRKGALWWLTQRERDGQLQVILRAVVDPDLL